MSPSPLKLEHAFDLFVEVAAPIEVGETALGSRRVISITGCRATGPKLKGSILNAGADFQLIHTDGLTKLEARYVIETDDGARVYVDNVGLRYGAPEALEKLRRGEPVDPSLIYFRCAPRFETGTASLRWLTHNLFVGTGARHPGHVEIAVWQVL